MFPISMAAQHRHLAGALAKIVSQSENVDDLTTFLEGLGRDHRKFGVVAERYDAGGSRACWRPWNISRGRPGRAERLFPGPAGQHGSDQRSHGAAAPGPGLSTP